MYARIEAMMERLERIRDAMSSRTGLEVEFEHPSYGKSFECRTFRFRVDDYVIYEIPRGRDEILDERMPLNSVVSHILNHGRKEFNPMGRRRPHKIKGHYPDFYVFDEVHGRSVGDSETLKPLTKDQKAMLAHFEGILVPELCGICGVEMTESNNINDPRLNCGGHCLRCVRTSEELCEEGRDP